MTEDEDDTSAFFLKKNVFLINVYTNRKGGVVGESGDVSCMFDPKVKVQVLIRTGKGT